jgi:hypothetical protein
MSRRPPLGSDWLDVILGMMDNLYNRWQASDCLPGIEQFGTRRKSRQAANCAPNMSAFPRLGAVCRDYYRPRLLKVLAVPHNRCP